VIVALCSVSSRLSLGSTRYAGCGLDDACAQRRRRATVMAGEALDTERWCAFEIDRARDQRYPASKKSVLISHYFAAHLRRSTSGGNDRSRVSLKKQTN
jgi:hypothetical protein